MSDAEKPALDLDALDTHDWHNDAKCENGLYTNSCALCGALFVGHKWRSCCRFCAFPELPALIARVRELEAKKIAVKRTFDADLAYARNDLKRAEAERDILQAQLNEMLAMDERRAISGNLPVSRSNGGKGTGPA